jgi:hypothetical protein
MKVNCKFLKNVATLKYLKITVTDGNYRCEDIKSRLNFVNSCCLSSRNFYHVVRIEIYETLNSTCYLYLWSFTLFGSITGN